MLINNDLLGLSLYPVADMVTPLSEHYPVKKQVTENKSKHKSLVYDIMVWNTAFVNLGEV